MSSTSIVSVLAEYPADCQPLRIEPLGHGGGFSGARLWRVVARGGSFCLRRWPPEADERRLRFIHRVMFHVAAEGFTKVPLPVVTSSGDTLVRCDGHWWELAMWLPGRADFRQRPSEAKLVAAMRSLAQLHRAAATFTHEDPGMHPSPGIAQRVRWLRQFIEEDARRIADRVAAEPREPWRQRADRILQLFYRHAADVVPIVEDALQLRVALQPCLRDVWDAHVLFEGDEVTGLVDWGAMRIESVAADVARLLGSLTAEHPQWWPIGMRAYAAVRPLQPNEQTLLGAFHRSNVLLGGMMWLRWLYLEEREFDEPQRVLERLDLHIAQLASFAATNGHAS